MSEMGEGMAAVAGSWSLVSGLGSEELEKELSAADRLTDVGNRALAFYLWEMEERRLGFELGGPGAVAYAVGRLGMGRRRAQELVAVGRQLTELAELDRAFRQGRVSWSKTRAMARVATGQTEAEWVAFGEGASQGEVEERVRGARTGEGPGKAGGLPKARFRLRFVLDALQQAGWEQARRKLRAEIGAGVTDGELLEELVRLFLSSDADGSVKGRKAVDGSLYRVVVQTGGEGTGAVDTVGGPVAIEDGEVEEVASDASGTTPDGLRKRVIARDGGRCKACASRRSSMVHHVVFRSRGGKTAASNLLTLCKTCHGLVHEGYVRVTGSAKRGFEITDRKGRRLAGKPRVGPGLEIARAMARVEKRAGSNAEPVRNAGSCVRGHGTCSKRGGAPA